MKNAIKIMTFMTLLSMQMVAALNGQETRTWLGSSDDWHDPANWLPFGVPGGQDDVIHENNGSLIRLGAYRRQE